MNKHSRKKLLILDIDNTLLFGVRHEPKFDCYQEDYCLLPKTDGFMHVPSDEINPGDKERYGLVNVYLRPHVREFMAFCQQSFTLAVYTTACLDHPMIASYYFFPDVSETDSPWLFVWSAEQCVREGENTKKDLQSIIDLTDYGESEILIVDDQPDVWDVDAAGIPENVIAMPEYGGDVLPDSLFPDDHVLLALQQFLSRFVAVDDIRTIDSHHWEDAYPHIIKKWVCNGSKACISYPRAVMKRKLGDCYYRTLCGEKPSIRGALWNIPSNACPDCERIAADMQP